MVANGSHKLYRLSSFQLMSVLMGGEGLEGVRVSLKPQSSVVEGD